MNVAIIGGGLVGALEACMLARRGLQVSIFESRHDGRHEVNYYGRSINLAISTRGISALKRVGLDNIVEELGIPMKARMIHDTLGNTTPIPYDPDGRCINSIERATLNNRLLDEAQRLGVNLCFGYKLVDMDPDEGVLAFRLRQNDGSFSNDLRIHKYDLILGCDGSKSSVRGLLSRMSKLETSQTYIDHCYLELRIASNDSNTFKIPPNYLHIWPRGEYMMIALPNKDFSFTCTLFISEDKYNKMNLSEKLEFFKKTFPDAVKFIGEELLLETLKNTKPSPLISVKCSPYNYKNKVVLLGDSAHAMVPFYGQGMNCGFEDCLVFDEMLDSFQFAPNNETKLYKAIDYYNRIRCPNGHAMCELALYNYYEMRDHVNKLSFKLRKTLDNYLYKLSPTNWIPLYTMVTFTRIPIHECKRRRDEQNKILKRALIIPAAFICVASCFILLHANVLRFAHSSDCQ